MPPPNFSSSPPQDDFSFLDHLPGASRSSRPSLFGNPGLDDSESDTQSQRGSDDGDGHEEIPNSNYTPPTSQESGSHDEGDGYGYGDEYGEDDEEARRRRRWKGKGRATVLDVDDDADVEMGEGEDDGAERNGREYELRRNIDREGFVGSGYVDADKTGDYDPMAESASEWDGLEDERDRSGGRGRRRGGSGGGGVGGSRRVREKPKGKKTRRVETEVDGEGVEDDDLGDTVDLGLDDDVAAMSGLNLNAGTPNQDGEDANANGDGDDEDDEVSDLEELGANKSDIDPEEANLRKVVKKRMPRKPRTPPKAQSCHSCSSRKLECSILDSPASYPCLNCQEMTCFCILPFPSTPAQRQGTRKAIAKERAAEKAATREKARKARELEQAVEKNIAWLKKQASKNKRTLACSECARDDIRCSYQKLGSEELEAGMANPCKRCVKYERICQPQPPPPEDIDPETGEVKRGKPKPLPKSQRPLPVFGSPVFGKERQERERAPGMEDVVETFFNAELPPKKPRNRKSKKGKPSKLSDEMVIDTPEEEPVPAGWAKKQIETTFCHPLVFNAPLAEDDEFGFGCDMHNTAFSIFGLGPVSPWVLYPDPPTEEHQFAYKEIPGTGGHFGTHKLGYVKTTICKSCTFARMKIMFCGEHRLTGIRNLPHPKAFNFDHAYAPLLTDSEFNFRSNNAENTKWCSICPAPAFLECCVEAPGGIRVTGSKEGCGLMLCEICATAMLSDPSDGDAGEERAQKEVEALLRSVKKLNVATRAQSLGIEIEEGGEDLSQLLQRKWVAQRRSLEEVIADAKRQVEGGGGKQGRYVDGLRADAEFLSRKGMLWEWMEFEADARRQRVWKASGVGSSIRPRGGGPGANATTGSGGAGGSNWNEGAATA